MTLTSKNNLPPPLWPCSAKTHKGNVRTLNEDAVLAAGEQGLWGVADGMGGHAAGDVASKMAVDSLADLRWQEGQSFSAKVDQVEDCLIDLNLRLLQMGREKHQGRVMGTTVVLLLADQHTGCCLWVGDSRLYRYRGGQLEQLSSDHSIVAELIAAGEISELEARSHPRRNQITRALGAQERLCLDIEIFDICCGDQFILCSDGVTNEMDHNALLQHLQNDRLRGTNSADCSQADCSQREIDCCAEGVLNYCLGKSARDNLSIVLTQVPSAR